MSHGSGILAGLKPAPGSGFRHLRPDEQAALMLIRDIDPFGMVLVDRDGVERMMLIFCYGGVFVVLLRRRRA